MESTFQQRTLQALINLIKTQFPAFAASILVPANMESTDCPVSRTKSNGVGSAETNFLNEQKTISFLFLLQAGLERLEPSKPCALSR